MSLLIILIISVVQGVTEFLPISSSGHLIIFYKLFGVTQGTLFLSIILHFATLLSIVAFYYKDLFFYLKNFKSKTTIKFIITTFTTLIFVLLFKNFLIGSFDGRYLIVCFIATSILLFIADQYSTCHKYSMFLSKNYNMKPKTFNFCFNSINNLKAGIVGLVQSFAVLPGISRSGSTISAMILMNCEKKESANYSFIISIPIVLGSLVFEMADFFKNPEPLGFSALELIVGFVVCFFVGLLSIKLLLKIIQAKKLSIFSFYLVILSIILLLFRVI